MYDNDYRYRQYSHLTRMGRQYGSLLLLSQLATMAAGVARRCVGYRITYGGSHSSHSHSHYSPLWLWLWHPLHRHRHSFGGADGNGNAKAKDEEEDQGDTHKYTNN
jgi:hypothetical protein